MILKKFLYFPILFIFFLSSISLAAYEIELKETEQAKSFVRPSGKVYDKYISGFTNDDRVEYFSTVVSQADTAQKKGRLGEKAAQLFFKDLGYQTLDNFIKKQNNRSNIYKNSSCSTKKGPDNGIDEIFVKILPEGDAQVIINEAKYREREYLHPADFGFIKLKGELVQQSHKKWLDNHLSQLKCFKDFRQNHSPISIERTATLLNHEGRLKLYEVFDK